MLQSRILADLCSFRKHVTDLNATSLSTVSSKEKESYEVDSHPPLSGRASALIPLLVIPLHSSSIS